VGSGTGLGLSTVIGIIRSYGGFISVYSEVGNGSVFKVALPAQSGEARTDVPKRAAEPVPRGNGEVILVVDDEPSILSVTSQTLEAFGYQTLTAEDGAHAIAVFARHRDKIAVVPTDMMMPAMDGPALIMAIYRIDPDARIIAASGLSAHLARATTAGVKHFLAKPYSAATLLRTIHSILASADA
jgi:CheY-like chemotaxis protein